MPHSSLQLTTDSTRPQIVTVSQKLLETKSQEKHKHSVVSFCLGRLLALGGPLSEGVHFSGEQAEIKYLKWDAYSRLWTL